MCATWLSGANPASGAAPAFYFSGAEFEAKISPSGVATTTQLTAVFAEPATASSVRTQLSAGTDLLVIGEPVLADGRRWSHVVIDQLGPAWPNQGGWVIADSN